MLCFCIYVCKNECIRPQSILQKIVKSENLGSKDTEAQDVNIFHQRRLAWDLIPGFLQFIYGKTNTSENLFKLN